MSWTLSLAYRRDQRTARAVEALFDIVRAEVGKLLAAGTWRSAGKQAQGRVALLSCPDDSGEPSHGTAA